jgi:vitamin B12 transporter
LHISRVVLAVVILLAAASATDLKIRVVDPHSAAIAGAEVILFRSGLSSPVDVQTTSSEGMAVLHAEIMTDYRLRVLAPGFAPQEQTVNGSQELLSIQLHLAIPAETVVVTATRAPVTEEEAGAKISALDANQLTVMHPVAAADGLRFLPGAVVEEQGQRGGLSSLFVRGGDSRYNKVIIDGVSVNDPGGTFDFGVVPLQQVERLEFVRGAQSTLYGSDAMTSVVQVWTQTGRTRTPELRFGADGGNFNTADGSLSLAGARGAFDYNLFGDQFNTTGQGPNDDYSNSSQGGNLGVQINPRTLFRVRVRHSNNRTGVPGEWNFNGQALQPPDQDQFARQNNLLGSAELTIAGPYRWQHRLTGFDYHHERTNVDTVNEPARLFDFPFHSFADINRAGFDYQGDYLPRTWARTTLGYEYENETGFVGDLDFSPLFHGLRRNQAVYAQEIFTLGRFSAIAGGRFVHNTTFGNKVVPRASLTMQVLKGGSTFSGTRLRFSYATGIKAARFEEAFANVPGSILPNPNLKAEENRAFEAGIEQKLLNGKYGFAATYYNNLFRNQIDFAILDSITFLGQYENIDKSMAHGAEVELHGRPWSRVAFDLAYSYASTQILAQPFAFDPLHEPGQPLLRRPKHSGSVLLNYLGRRWGANLGGSFVGRRPDSDFLGFNIDHAAGYARVDLGGWYAVNSRITAYVNVENALDKHYNEVVGYPALTANFRAGLRFRIGGE